MQQSANGQNNDLKIPTEFPADFSPTPACGLTAAEAGQRLEKGLGNRSNADQGRSVAQILFSNFFTFFNMLNIALAVCLLLVGSYKNMLFMGVVISNTLISTVQELRAKETIKKLKIASMDNAEVIRDGKHVFLPPQELVKDDLVCLGRGCQVPADAIAVSGSAALNESLLTGESVPIPKQPNDWVLSGSFVTSGSLVCQLVHVGDESYVNRLTSAAKKINAARSKLMADLDRLLHYLTVILIPLGLALFAKEFWFSGQALPTAVQDAVASMIGMIPEGLMLLTSVALAVGVVRLGKKGALVQELYGIETLARADVLCLDKTGTLTTGDLSLSGIIPVDVEKSRAEALLRRFLGAFPNENAGTLQALKNAFTPSNDPPVDVLNFSSERKKSAAAFADGQVLILGAPSFVMGDGYTGTLKEQCEGYAGAGRRVLLFCEAQGGIGKDGELPEAARIICVLTLEDTIRDNARDTLQWFRDEGVDIRIISGDDPITVSSIGKRLDLPGADRYIDVAAIQTDEEVAAAANQYVVFGRVTPERKRMIVQSLKKAGHHVAMTGDGVNDIPALRAADCSICMAGGTEAAKHASQLTLVASDFTALPAIVAEGRRVVNNVTRAASLFLVKTLYSFLLSVILLFMPAGIKYPFYPIQLTLISSLTVGAPSFFLSLEANKQRIRGDFIKTITSQALPSALAVTLCALTLMLTQREMSLASTLATMTAAFIGVATLVKVSLPMNRRRAALIACMAALLTAAIFFFPGLFELVALQGSQFWLLGAFCAGGTLIMYGLTCAFRRFGKA
ncbi:MAG: HAD-IC family P-type ATPase [Clostridia bacterium]|nr:HAD-IC family P-type ATPase [Clostridia bacterium]